MRSRSVHRGLCLVALVAYLFNLAFVASGAVICQDPQGQPRFELACDHSHCGPSGEVEHDHGDPVEACWCAACPCEDMPLGICVTATVRGDEWQGTPQSSPHYVLALLERGMLLEGRRQRAYPRRPPPAVDQTLRRLRTIILIV